MCENLNAVHLEYLNINILSCLKTLSLRLPTTAYGVLLWIVKVDHSSKELVKSHQEYGLFHTLLHCCFYKRRRYSALIGQRRLYN